jgi:hypothetical protein
MTELPIVYQNAVEVSGQMLRHGIEAPMGEGVFGRGHLRVTAGAGLSVDVSSGTAWVKGDAITDQGLYRIRNDATKASSAFEAGGIPTAHASNPRIDQIIARVYDHDADASGFRKWRLEVLPGVAHVGFYPLGPLIGERVSLVHTDHDLKQGAAAMVLPRSITATRIRWKYAQGATPIAGNYVIAIYDPSGRKLVDTGSVAFAGAADTFQEAVLTIASTNFEGGVFYVFIGVDTTAGSCAFNGISTSADNAGGNRWPGAPAVNLAVRLASGGVTAPTTLLGFTDLGVVSGVNLSPAAPLVSLSA